MFTTVGPGPFHPLEWSSCGESCETADVTAGFGPWAATSAAGTRRGAAYAFWGHPLGDAAGHDFLEQLVRLRDGVTVAAMGVQYGGPTCANSYAPNSALVLWHMAGRENGELQSWALAADPSRGWTFTPSVPSSDEPPGRMAFEAGDRIIGLGKGTVHALAPPSSTWEILESPSSSLYGAGGDEWAVWVESNSRRLRAFRADGAGIRTLTESVPTTTCALAVGSSSVLGVASDACLGGSRKLQVWSNPMTEGSTPSVVATLQGPVYLSAPDSIRSYGDYAAILARPLQDAGTQGVPYFAVIRLSTGTVWRIGGRTPFVIQDTTWTLDDTFLYWGERSEADLDGHLIRRMVRVPLSKVDVIGTPL